MARRTPEQVEHSARGRIGAYTLHATHDPKVTSAPGRAAFWRSFEKLVDPDGVLPLSERLRRADAARHAHFARMARLSARARLESGRRVRRPER